MLFHTKPLTGYRLRCLDGMFGEIAELFFDDFHWTVRYLVAATGTSNSGGQVLVSPYALLTVSDGEKLIEVNLSTRQIQDSPLPSRDRPVSRQLEAASYKYYGWPKYWTGTYAWGSYPTILQDNVKRPADRVAAEKPTDHCLRSTVGVTGYRVQASDSQIGHIDDFIVDDKAWTIRYLVVNTSWPTKRQVLVSPKWIECVSWADSLVRVNLSRESIRKSPSFSEKALLTREYEAGLHSHYSRVTYWNEEGEGLQAKNRKT